MVTAFPFSKKVTVWTKIDNCLMSPAYSMSFTKFNDFRRKTFKRANSQTINFLERFCDSLSVKIIFLLTQVLRWNSLKPYKYFKQAVQAKTRSLKWDGVLYSNRLKITNDIQRNFLRPTNHELRKVFGSQFYSSLAK